ncbi:pyrroline-5-carboxylate reductase [Bacteroides sp. 224]|uniref:pyrroline-5-carboxylate reductase n=1 Tax=Bacteroides sp. 224 TaxID=2302936 RepID=UPI0013D4168A|nr:pyrroline-5-carboxylate reductase [Bacteroides sp. 224]NDV64072.1 pyrroline-5-carboxylate reductase [Bacteroides sp. 224]
MRITIIGAGNMGGAIARGLTLGTLVKAADITVSDPSKANLDKLTAFNKDIQTISDNQEAIADADIVMIAVKPWLMKEVISNLQFKVDKQIIVSVAAGISLSDLADWTDPVATLFRLVPNTAISELASMTLIASMNATSEQEQILLNLFNELGLAMLIPEKQIPATTAMTSCGIAYALKYIQAGLQAGVEMGVYPKDAMKMVAQSLKGAAELILNNDTHPAVEIDKVTTPGGLTIKGINELEHAGFTSAIIKAMKESAK